MRSLLFAVLSLACVRDAAADAVDGLVERAMARSHVPGAAVAVIDHGRVVKLAAYGRANLEWDVPVDLDTAFQLASATKIFTGIALMRLVEQGRLSLDDPLSAFFADAPPAWSRIRVGQLASHTSGLADDLGQPRPQGVAEIVAAAQRHPLAYAPGSESRYGFTDFVVLRALLERVSGKSLPQLFHDEIFAPLQIGPRFAFARNDGPSIRSAEIVPRRASIHAWKDGRQRSSEFLYGEPGYGAGGLYASIRDLATLFVAQDHARLLQARSWRTLQAPPLLTDGRRGAFGIGWSVRRHRGVELSGHSGGPALADIVRVDARQLTVVVLTNQQRYYPLLAEAIVDLYLPPAAEPAAIGDARPELTALLRTTLADAARGRVDPSRFAAGAANPAAAFLADLGAVLLEAVGPIRRIDLLAERSDGARRLRSYRIAFEHATMHWRLETVAGDRIEVLRPAGSDER